MKVSIVTFDNFTDIDLFLLWDLLKRVQHPDWTVKIIGDKPTHVSSTGIDIKMHGRLDEANSSDAVLFCSGKGSRQKIAEPDFLKAFHLDASKQLLGAVDSGALILAALGFLKGKRATTYPVPDLKKKLEDFGAEVVWESFVQQGNIATAAQCLSGQYLAGWLIETLIGKEERKRVLESIASLDEVSVSPEQVVQMP